MSRTAFFCGMAARNVSSARVRLIDVLRVDNTCYYSASTMHYSSGAPILRSYDLVNWEFAEGSGHLLNKNWWQFTT